MSYATVDELAIFPLSDVLISVDELEGAEAMRFAIFPISDVHTSVGKLEGAMAMPFAIFPISDVHTSILEDAVAALGVEGAEEKAQEHRYKRRYTQSVCLHFLGVSCYVGGGGEAASNDGAVGGGAADSGGAAVVTHPSQDLICVPAYHVLIGAPTTTTATTMTIRSMHDIRRG